MPQGFSLSEMASLPEPHASLRTFAASYCSPPKPLCSKGIQQGRLLLPTGVRKQEHNREGGEER